MINDVNPRRAASDTIRRSVVAIAFFSLLLLGPSVQGDTADWPQFHGPNRDNRSAETGLLKEWPPDGPKLLWTARGLGHGFATITVSGGTIYTSGDRDGKSTISALDRDGRLVWQQASGAAWEASVPGSRGAPTIDGDRLYHENAHGDIVCLDAKTGKKHWSVNILTEFQGKNINWGLSESLLIDGDRVICCPGGPETAVVALDKHTGRTVWKSASAGDLAGYASPALGEYQDLRMIFTLTSRAAIGVNADSGELLWRFEQITPFEEMITMPIYYDGHVLISTRTAGTALLALEVDGKRCSVREVWRTKVLDNQHGGLVLLDGYVYGSSHVNSDGKWICVEWKTGKVMYVDRGVGKGSITYADGMLYMLSENRTLGLVKASPASYQLVGQFKIPAGGEGPSWAHPVVCGGRLYVRHGEFLYAYDVRHP
jgi:outer membrane protein assembly factor BamB